MNLEIKITLILFLLFGAMTSQAAEKKIKKKMPAPVKAVKKLEVTPVAEVKAQEHVFNLPQKRKVQFKIQRMKSVDSTPRGWVPALEPTFIPKVVILPQPFISESLKDRLPPPAAVQAENHVAIQEVKILTEKEERMLAAKILEQKNKCYLSIGLWKAMGHDEEALTCLVHDQYDDVAMMNLKNPKTEDSDILLSRLSPLQIKQVDENFIKNSYSLKAQAILAFEKGNYKEVLEKVAKLEPPKKENYKVSVLKVLSLSGMNKNEEALDYV